MSQLGCTATPLPLSSALVPSQLKMAPTAFLLCHRHPSRGGSKPTMVPFGGCLSQDSKISSQEIRDILPPRQEVEATARILFVSQTEKVREHPPALLCFDLEVN